MGKGRAGLCNGTILSLDGTNVADFSVTRREIFWRD